MLTIGSAIVEKSLRFLAVFLPLIVGLGSFACTEQHDPRPYWNQFEKEREAANQPEAKLSPTGELLTGAALAGGKTAEENFGLYCANCHGAEGMGNGPGATANPPPRNFTDVAWQNSTTDERISKVIREGGPSVGLSAAMAPWGAVLKASEIADMVEYVRQFKK